MTLEHDDYEDQKTVSQQKELPITMPSSLEVATLFLPVPMTAEDFSFLIDFLEKAKSHLVRSTY